MARRNDTALSRECLTWRFIHPEWTVVEGASTRLRRRVLGESRRGSPSLMIWRLERPMATRRRFDGLSYAAASEKRSGLETHERVVE